MKSHQKFNDFSSLIIIVLVLCNNFTFASSVYLADFIKEIDQLDTPKDFNLPFTLKMIIKSQSFIFEKYNVDLSSEYEKLHATYHSIVLNSRFYKNDEKEMSQNTVYLNESSDLRTPVPMTVRLKITMGKNEKCDPAEIENCFISQYISKFSSHFGMVVFSLAEILELVNHLNFQASLVEANGFQKTLSNKNAHIFLGNNEDLLNLYHDRVLNSKLKTEDVPPGFKFLRNFRVKFGIDLETSRIFTEHLEKMIQIQIPVPLENHRHPHIHEFIGLGEAVKNGRFNSPFILREKFMSMGTFGIRHHFMKMEKRDKYGHDHVGAGYNLAVAASRVHNFSWVMTPYPLNTELLEDGSWNGYMGDLIDDKIFSYTFHAAPYGSEIETSISTWSYVSAVEFLRGRPTASINWTALYAPFSRSVWGLIFVTLALLMIVFTWNQIPLHDENDTIENENPFLIFLTRKGKAKSFSNKLQQNIENKSNGFEERELISNPKRFRLETALVGERQRQSVFERRTKRGSNKNESGQLQQKLFEVAQEKVVRELRNQQGFEEVGTNSSSSDSHDLWRKVKLMKMGKTKKFGVLENEISPTSGSGSGRFHHEWQRGESWKKNMNEKPAKFEMSMIHTSFLSTLAPLLSQGWKIPKRARFLALIWIFMSLVLSNFYQSDLLSLITIPTPEPIPQTFEELDRRSDMKVTLMYLPGIPCDLFFRYTKIPLFVRLNKKAERVPDQLECVRKVVTESKRVCIGWHTIIMPIAGNTLTIHRQIPSTFFSKDNAFSSPVSTSVKKNSRWEGAMREVTGWLRDTGHIEQWKDDVKNYVEGISVAHFKEQRRGPKEQMSEQLRHLEDMLNESAGANTAKPFTIDLLATPFGILAFGSFVASLFFMSENRWKILHFISKKRQRQNET